MAELIDKLRFLGYERIADHIELLRGSQELQDYLFDLVVVTDREHRQGFPKEVFNIIVKLYNQHHQDKPGCVWEIVKR